MINVGTRTTKTLLVIETCLFSLGPGAHQSHTVWSVLDTCDKRHQAALSRRQSTGIYMRHGRLSGDFESAHRKTVH